MPRLTVLLRTPVILLTSGVVVSCAAGRPQEDELDEEPAVVRIVSEETWRTLWMMLLCVLTQSPQHSVQVGIDT